MSLYKLFKKYAPKNEIRPMIAFVKKLNKTGLIGCEIGVREGYNAVNILQNLNIKKLYLVDPYLPYYIKEKGETRDPSNTERACRKRLILFGNRAIFIKEKSEDAIKQIKDELDFVYIDGNHAYEFVKRDLELYYPKVKVGGVIGGHDFKPKYYGVAKAVLEFTEKNELKPYGKGTDWWFVK